jgi:RNA polymerase primary sigma factor
VVDKTLDELVLENRGFVYDMAKNYSTSGVPFNDLVNAGMLGLVIAAKKYDVKREVKFISFATCWVQHEMIKVIRETRFPCRIPLNLNKVINQARRGELEDTDPALADIMPLLKTPEALQFNDTFSFGQGVVDRVSVIQALETVDLRTREMIKMLFGIERNDSCNIPEISEAFNLSRQRVRNIIKAGLLHIRKALER